MVGSIRVEMLEMFFFYAAYFVYYTISQVANYLQLSILCLLVYCVCSSQLIYVYIACLM